MPTLCKIKRAVFQCSSRPKTAHLILPNAPKQKTNENLDKIDFAIFYYENKTIKIQFDPKEIFKQPTHLVAHLQNLTSPHQSQVLQKSWFCHLTCLVTFTRPFGNENIAHSVVVHLKSANNQHSMLFHIRKNTQICIQMNTVINVLY